MKRWATLLALGALLLTSAASSLPAVAEDQHAGHGGAKQGMHRSDAAHHTMMERMMAGMSAAEKKHMHEHMGKMSAPQRKKMMDRMMKMSPADRRKMAQRMMDGHGKSAHPQSKGGAPTKHSAHGKGT